MRGSGRGSTVWCEPACRSLLTAVGLIAAVWVLAGCGTASRSTVGGASRAAKVCHAARGGVVVARPLGGDQLAAGPVLVGHAAVWAESLHRMRIRSVDARGCVRTIFLTSTRPRPPKGQWWWYDVTGLAGGEGRVALVESMAPCRAARPSVERCEPGSDVPPPARVTLLSGPPGHIRPVETVQHLDRHRCAWVPQAVAVVDAGLVVQEAPAGACAQWTIRLVLRSFSGRLVRVLARGARIQYEVAAGSWVMYTTYSNSDSSDEALHVINVTTGRTVLRVHRGHQHAIVAYAIDRSGRFALTTAGPDVSVCGRREDVSPLRVGQIGHAGLRLIDEHSLGYIPDVSVAISGDRVAYGRRTGRCLDRRQLVIRAPGSAPTVIAHMDYSDAEPLRFDGRVVATARGRASGSAAGGAIVLRAVR
jgi:hypothetical protein